MHSSHSPALAEKILYRDPLDRRSEHPSELGGYLYIPLIGISISSPPRPVLPRSLQLPTLYTAAIIKSRRLWDVLPTSTNERTKHYCRNMSISGEHVCRHLVVNSPSVIRRGVGGSENRVPLMGKGKVGQEPEELLREKKVLSALNSSIVPHRRAIPPCRARRMMKWGYHRRGCLRRS